MTEETAKRIIKARKRAGDLQTTMQEAEKKFLAAEDACRHAFNELADALTQADKED